MSHEIVVCEGCGAPAERGAGRELAQALAARLPEGFALRRVGCMSICADPVSLAVRCPGKATYLFAGLGLRDLEGVLVFAALFAASEDGWIEDARPAGRVRFCLRGRIPA
jgi:predicted metal-binding protein